MKDDGKGRIAYTETTGYCFRTTCISFGREGDVPLKGLLLLWANQTPIGGVLVRKGVSRPRLLLMANVARASRLLTVRIRWAQF